MGMTFIANLYHETQRDDRIMLISSIITKFSPKPLQNQLWKKFHVF